MTLLPYDDWKGGCFNEDVRSSEHRHFDLRKACLIVLPHRLSYRPTLEYPHRLIFSQIDPIFPPPCVLAVLCSASGNAKESISFSYELVPRDKTYKGEPLDAANSLSSSTYQYQLIMQMFTLFAVLAALFSTVLGHIRGVSGPSTYAATSSSTYPLTFSTVNGATTKYVSSVDCLVCRTDSLSVDLQWWFLGVVRSTIYLHLVCCTCCRSPCQKLWSRCFRT